VADLDVLTPDEAYQAINVKSSSVGHDEDVLRAITAVSLRLDEMCGPVVVRTITDEPHTGGRSVIFLRTAPVASVTTVKEYAGTTLTTLTAESVTSQTANQYWFESDTGILYRRSGGCDCRFATGRGNVLVTYEPGRFATTEDVDGRFKEAASLILNDWYQASASWWEKNSSFDAEGGLSVLPPRSFNRALQVIGEARRSPRVA
jgi:hypothetical protein